MSLITGLAAIKARVEADEAKFGNTDYVKAEWFKLADKKSANVQFLQTLDKSAPDYSEKNGLAVLAVEHSHPKLYRNKAICSFEEEGRCYGCEMNDRFPKTGWKQKTKLYINVLADYGDGDPKVQILSSGLGKGQVAPVLLEMIAPDVVEEDDEPVILTKTKFRITRSGAGLQDTSYLLTAKGASKNDPEAHELWDLNKVLRTIPYAEQEGFYNRGAVAAEEEAKELVTAGAAPEDEWV